MAYRVTRTAQNQIDLILLRSAENFGADAAERYTELIEAAMTAIGDEPARPGSSEIPRLQGIRAYAIRLARETLKPRQRLKTSRHLIIYRVGTDGVAEILGFVHDRMVLIRAARRLVPR